MQYRHKILVVDDNLVNITILEELLEEDYEVVSATSGEEALTLAPQFSPDMILLDVMMPGIDGYETCRRLRSYPALSSTKIIMVSAKAMITDRIKGYEVGADDYITKPFEQGELLAKVRVYLRLKSIEEIDQLKSNFLALLTHKTGTPLHNVLMAFEILQASLTDIAPEQKTVLDLVHQSTLELHHLLKRVLTLCKMKAGAWDFQFLDTEPRQLVESVVTQLEQEASQRNIVLIQELDEVGEIQLDSQWFREVMTILLSNALRYSPSKERISITLSREMDWVRMSVTDHGPGIAPDFLPHLLQGFASLESMQTSEQLGLSLALAQEIIQAHRGTFTVESVEGEATTFTVRLPIQSCQEKTVANADDEMLV